MQRQWPTSDLTKKNRFKFISCVIVFIWLFSSIYITSAIRSFISFNPPLSPEEAIVQCHYDRIYTIEEDYQFEVKDQIGYHCCESKHDIIYDKIVTIKMIIMMREVQCEKTLKVTYKVDLFNHDTQKNIIDDSMRVIHEKFPLNTNVTYWYYPGLHWLEKENYLIDHPLESSEEFYFLYVILSFLLLGTLFLPCLIFFYIKNKDIY